MLFACLKLSVFVRHSDLLVEEGE